MKITGWRTLKALHNWGRPIGDINGSLISGVTEIPFLVLETDEGICMVSRRGAMPISSVSSRPLKAKIPARLPRSMMQHAVLGI